MKKVTFAYDTDVIMPMDDGGNVVIHTTVTNSGNAVKRFLQEVRSRKADGGGSKGEPGLIVGLDTEWRVVFDGDGYSDHKMAVLQLCVGRRCLVFQIIHADYVPATLKAFLACPEHRFVGVSIDGDVERLYCDNKILVGTPVDLRHVAAEVLSRPELARAGLKTLAHEVMGVLMEKPKHVTMSKWSRPLSPEQVRYAAIDAFVSYEIGRLLLTSQRALELEDAAAAAGTISPFVCFELP